MGDVVQRALTGRERVVADVREVIQRVWRARREIATARGMDIARSDAIFICVGVDFWDALWALNQVDADYSIPGGGTIQRRVVPVEGHEPEWGVFLMGIRVKRDERLDPRGVVIRAEVVA